MRLWLLLIASLALSTSVAQAQVPFRHMGWGDSAFGNQQISPDCNALPNQSKLVISFTAPSNVHNLTGVWGYIDSARNPTSCHLVDVLAIQELPRLRCRRQRTFEGPSTEIDPGRPRAGHVCLRPSPLLDAWGMARIEVWVQASDGAPTRSSGQGVLRLRRRVRESGRGLRRMQLARASC
jgi:hypothetical protein